MSRWWQGSVSEEHLLVRGSLAAVEDGGAGFGQRIMSVMAMRAADGHPLVNP